MVLAAEQNSTMPVEIIRNRGYCHCCRSTTEFVAYDQWLRDFYVCANCSSLPRQRHIQAILDTHFSGWDRKAIHESSPSNDLISRHCINYSSSQYLKGIPTGSLSGGVRCESIEQLTYADKSFDIFITQDVLEHVFHPDRAIREILRVLKPDGIHIFTAPKHKGKLISERRARLNAEGEIEYILPAEYHGNPVGDGKALVTFDYGYDFEGLLSEWAGGLSVQVFHTKDRSKGIDADYNEVFVIHA